MSLQVKKLKDLVASIDIQNNQMVGILPKIVFDKFHPRQTKTQLARVWKYALELHNESYDKPRKALLKEFAEPDPENPEGYATHPNGHAKFKNPAQMQKFSDAVDTLLETGNLEVSGISTRLKFPESFEPRDPEGGSIDKLFSAEDMLNLSWLIEFPGLEDDEPAASPEVAATPEQIGQLGQELQEQLTGS